MATPTWQISQEDLRDPTTETQRIVVGDRVWLRDMDLPGTVLSLYEYGHQVEVQVGHVTLILNIETVERIAPSGARPSSET
ncbi:hypothetical protein ACFLST_02055, partial [Chloroflexota bacterium]